MLSESSSFASPLPYNPLTTLSLRLCRLSVTLPIVHFPFCTNGFQVEWFIMCCLMDRHIPHTTTKDIPACWRRDPPHHHPSAGQLKITQTPSSGCTTRPSLRPSARLLAEAGHSSRYAWYASKCRWKSGLRKLHGSSCLTSCFGNAITWLALLQRGGSWLIRRANRIREWISLKAYVCSDVRIKL